MVEGHGRGRMWAKGREVKERRSSTELRRKTRSLATYTYKCSRYEEVPENIAKELIAAHEKEKAGSSESASR